VKSIGSNHAVGSQNIEGYSLGLSQEDFMLEDSQPVSSWIKNDLNCNNDLLVSTTLQAKG
jgi:putative two-component system response regulator